MRDHYGAARMVLSAAGKLDHDALVELADKLLRRPAGRARGAATEPARYVGGEFREDRDLEQVHLVLGFPGLPLGDPDYYAASVLSTAARRRHVVAAVPGGAREARPGLLDLLLRRTATAMAACSASMPAPARTRPAS